MVPVVEVSSAGTEAEAVGVTKVKLPAVEIHDALLGYECAGLQAKPEVVEDGTELDTLGVTSESVPAVEMHVASPGYE